MSYVDKAIKAAKALYQAILLGLTSYEAGKNSANSEKQIVIAHPTVTEAVNSDLDSTNGIYILIGLVIFIIVAFLTNEMRKMVQCARPVQQPIEMRNRNQNNNNIDV